jgi:hypothetical protein
MTDNAFDNARAHARPDCPKCHGTGAFAYDYNHTTICNLCCTHNMGWWQLREHYGADNDKWCCRAGCGLTLDEEPSTQPPRGNDGGRAAVD